MDAHRDQPLPQKGGRAPTPQTPQSAHFYCGQTVGCIKMLLGMEVGLRPGDFVRWGRSALHKRGQSPNFWSMSIAANAWMHQGAT